MPRTARQHIPGVAYHLIWRFVDRSWFFTDDEERSVYLDLLGRALANSDWRCLAYALMSNHVHIAAIGGARDFGDWAKAVNSPFARWMNERHGRLGPVFADRAKDVALASSREGHVIAYIHNNPVRAKIVTHPRDSTWTSHRAYAGLARAPSWLHVSEGMLRAGFYDPAHFDQWVARTPGESGEADVAQIRRELRARGTLQTATPSAAIVPLVRRPFAHLRPDPRVIPLIVAGLTGVEVDLIRSRRRIPAAISARRVCAAIARVAGIGCSDMAATLGVTPSAVTQATRRKLTSDETTTFHLALQWLEIELGEAAKNRPFAVNEDAALGDAAVDTENRP